MPDAIPAPSRRDDEAADLDSLVELGQAEPQPVPAPSTSPFQEPAYPGLPDGYAPDDLS